MKKIKLLTIALSVLVAAVVLTGCDETDECLARFGCGEGSLTRVSIELSITDLCDDGWDTGYIFLDMDHVEWFPSETTMWSVGFGMQGTQTLECIEGAEICYGADPTDGFGAFPTDYHWGIGVFAEYSCDGCCVTCSEGLVYAWDLICDG